ncbi:MAG TPA: DNA polymerase III subunit delta [Dehalococcoidales bacterium]|nr:DNA polymerase III subunit delta [Dehalococcoidales bacterium]
MLYILSGPDDYSLARTLDEIKRELGDPSALAMSVTTLEGRQVTPDELKVTCQTLPFLSGKRLVVIEGLLGRFEPRAQPRRQTRARQADTNDADRHKPFAASLSNIPESTIVALIEEKITGKNPLFKDLAGPSSSGRMTVKDFPLLKEPALRDFAQKRVSSEGGSISPKAVTMLVRLVGSNLWSLASEIDKLILFANGRRIEEEDVKTMVGYAQQTTVFVMIDAVLNYQPEQAEQALQRLLRDGDAPIQLLAMLARQVQLIVRAKELRNQRKSVTEIQSALGIPQEFIVRKTLEQANRYSLPRLREVYHSLLDTDLSIKTGQYDAELAMTILVAELSRRSKVAQKVS